MKTRKKALLVIVLCLSITLSGFSFSFGAVSSSEQSKSYMQQTVEELGEYLDGEEMFDYLSYVYLGWRTTGGSWQNQVIDTFIYDQLKDAGYTGAGAGATDSNSKSDNDKSSATDDDYAWVTYFDDVESLTWDPEYAKLEVSVEDEFEGKDQLIDRINVESAAFNPTTETYLEYYDVDSIDEMWQWITEKDGQGNRVNVINGEEAKLNDRVHLAWNSSFTDPAGTKPEDAQGVTGEAVYIGTISGTSCSEGYSAEELKGKVILTDSSLRSAFTFAQNVGAVAVASKASLSSYSVPKDENGNIISPFEESARYASGASLSLTKDSNIVEWQFSTDQYNALRELLKKTDKPVMVKNIAVGKTYAMNDASQGGKGQAIALAEIKGSSKPDERVFLCAHVQEPGSNDNATGVATLLGMATAYKEMIDSGVIERPERTITFMWGDEMSMARLYMSSHAQEKEGIVSVLNLDMTGEDPDKTGRSMRIEKTPDPSAVYNYTLDTLPWEEPISGPGYDDTFKDASGEFVRLPDSHTLWGAGSLDGLFQEGYFLNDLYMYATQNVIAHHDDTFEVDVCPYEGGSDHSRFLEQNIPALLTWHFTDYTYHTSVDTLDMSSASEMENVGITSMAAGLMMANTTQDSEELAEELLAEVLDAAMVRFDKEQQNTLNHQIYAKGNGGDYETALANEKEVLTAWYEWYDQALESVEKYLLDEKASKDYRNLRAKYAAALEDRYVQAVAFAEEMIQAEPAHKELVKVEAKEATAEADGNIEYWHCTYCDKYYADAEATEEITLADTVIKYVPDETDKPDTDKPTVDPDKDKDLAAGADDSDKDKDAQKADQKDGPQTGDNNQLMLFVGVLAVSFMGVIGMTLKRRKE